MNKGGPIMIIEDDVDDREILSDVFERLQIRNEVKFLVTESRLSII